MHQSSPGRSSRNGGTIQGSRTRVPPKIGEKLMYATPAQLVEFQKGQLDAFNSLGHTVFSAAEKLVNLNLAAAKAVMQDAADTTQTLLGAKDVQELVALTS